MRGKITVIQVTEFLSLCDAVKIRNNVREFDPFLVWRKIEGKNKFAVCRAMVGIEDFPDSFLLEIYPPEIIT